MHGAKIVAYLYIHLLFEKENERRQTSLIAINGRKTRLMHHLTQIMSIMAGISNER